MQEQRLRRLYGRLSDNDAPILEGNLTRMDLVDAARSEDVWYVVFPAGITTGDAPAVAQGPPNWAEIPPEEEIAVVRRVKAGEFLAFLDVTRRFAKPTELRAVGSTDKGNPPNGGNGASKVSYVTGDFGMGGGGGSNRGNTSPTDTDTEEDDLGDYVEWPSCPSTLGFRC